jgi:hypothetical protein
MREQATIIKSIETNRFHIALLQTSNGNYYVKYDLILDEDEQPVTSVPMKDLNIALSVFDTQLQELEGN